MGLRGQGWPFPGSPDGSHRGVWKGALEPHDHHAWLPTFLRGAPQCVTCLSFPRSVRICREMSLLSPSEARGGRAVAVPDTAG